MADALTNMLSAIPGLTVAPVEAADRVARATDTLAAARSLELDQMLEGSVDLADERLKVSARLVDVSTGRTRLAETFAQAQASATALQDAITQWVAQSMLQSTAVDPVHSYHPRSAEAFFLQLQARASLRAHAPVPAMRALVLFEQAVAAGILTETEAAMLKDYDRRVMEIVHVDDFEPYELGATAELEHGLAARPQQVA